MSVFIGIAVFVAASFALAIMVGKTLKWQRENNTIPMCFGNMPDNPGHRAEYDCHSRSYRCGCYTLNPPKGSVGYEQTFPHDRLESR